MVGSVSCGLAQTERRGGSGRRGAPVALGLRFCVFLMAVSIGCGCGSTSLDGPRMRHDRGDFTGAFEAGMRSVSNGQSQDRIWLLMEAGKFAQDAGAFGASDGALEQVWEIAESQRTEPYLRVSHAMNDINAFVVDERRRRYTPSPPELVLSQTAQAINAIMMGDLLTAQVQSRRLMQMQQRLFEFKREGEVARQTFDAEILRFNQQRAREEARAAASAARGEAFTLGQIEGLREYQSEQRYLDQQVRSSAIGFVAGRAIDERIPYGHYVGAIAAAYGGEANLANAHLLELSRTTDAPGPTLGQRRVYVLFENGRGPRRGPLTEVMDFDLTPLPVMRVQQHGRAGGLIVRSSAGQSRAVRIGSVEAAICQDFSDRLWSIWGRPILSSVVKIAAGAWMVYDAQQEEEKDTWDSIQELIGVGLMIAGAAAQPDLRNWQSLPAEHWVCEIPMPSDGQIRVELVLGGRAGHVAHVSLPPDQSGFVFVRTTSERGMIVHATPLSDDRLPDGFALGAAE